MVEQKESGCAVNNRNAPIDALLFVSVDDISVTVVVVMGSMPFVPSFVENR